MEEDEQTKDVENWFKKAWLEDKKNIKRSLVWIMLVLLAFYSGYFKGSYNICDSMEMGLIEKDNVNWISKYYEFTCIDIERDFIDYGGNFYYEFGNNTSISKE